MLKLISVILSCFVALELCGAATPQRKGTARQSSARAVAIGKRLFVAHCARCHGIDGTGGRGPSLAHTRFKHASDDKGLAAIIKNGLEGKEMPAFWQMSDKEIRQVVAYVRSLSAVARVKVPGDPRQGEEIFRVKGGCATCHVANGEGNGYGPDLSEIGAARSPAYLKESITNPGAAVPEGFLMVRVKTRDGADVEGLRVNEDSFTIQVRDSKNQFHSFRKLEISELKKEFGRSPMPSYVNVLSSSEIDDLVAYLAGLRGDR
jgi:cytochrome c oxidase cbb3-type subunit 3